MFIDSILRSLMMDKEEEEEEEEEEGRRWSDLPKDLLELILKRLDNMVDYHRFGWVCTKWQSVVIDGHVPSPRHPPWLVIDYKSIGRGPHPWYELQVIGEFNYCYDFLKGRGRSVVLRIPNKGGWNCYSCSHGWLILGSYRGYRVSLLNPISILQIHLPPNGKKGSFNFAEKAVISSPHLHLPLPRDGGGGGGISEVLLLDCRRPPLLKSCRVGDEEWSTELSDIIEYDGMIRDFIFYKGLLYVLVAKGKSLVTIYRFDHPTRPTKEKIVSFSFQMPLFVCNYYLVESGSGSGGELILVGVTINREFLVYKLDEDGLRWGEIKGLDINHTLFLGDLGSVSISPQDSIALDLENNSVLVEGGILQNFPLFHFSMEDHELIRSIPRRPPSIYGRRRSSSCWFMPSAPPKTLS